MVNGDKARPPHISDEDWENCKLYWEGDEQQRERHSSDPTSEKVRNYV